MRAKAPNMRIWQMLFCRWVWPWQTWWRRCTPTALSLPPCCRGGRQGGDRRLTATFSLLRWELGSFRNQIYEDLLQYFKIQLCSFSVIPTLSRISLHNIFACMKHSSPFQQYFHTMPLRHYNFILAGVGHDPPGQQLAQRRRGVPQVGHRAPQHRAVPGTLHIWPND